MLVYLLNFPAEMKSHDKFGYKKIDKSGKWRKNENAMRIVLQSYAERECFKNKKMAE